MSDSMKSNLPDADMQAAPGALLRAAERAREVARRTNTPIVIIRDGVLVEERVVESSDEARAMKLPELEGFREPSAAVPDARNRTSDPRP